MFEPLKFTARRRSHDLSKVNVLLEVVLVFYPNMNGRSRAHLFVLFSVSWSEEIIA